MQTSSEPYIGPRPFEQTDREFFFGRTQEANELVSLITAHAAVLLYAQSGAGKTSLVKAGLIPLLVDEEKFTVIPPMRVRENVAASLRPEGVDNVYMFNALSSISEPDAVAGLANLSLTDYLNKCKKSSGNGDSCSATTIIFDQFEELFTLYPERWEDRKAFFMQVRDALAQNPLLRVLFSMREDFIAELDPYVSLMPEKMRTRLRIERLRAKTALGAVTQPLEKVQTPNGKRRFAPNVAEELVNNLLQVKVKTPDGIKKVKGEFVEALQLQVVCQALWQNLRAEDELITHADLEAYGDVDKALVLFYENAIKNTIDKTGIKQGKLREWFERALITPTGTRGTVFRGKTETGGIPNEVVDELENQRIIRMELRGGAQWYELTHDRFVETVQTSNQNWQLSLPATEQVRKRLEERAADWDHNDRADKYLLDDVELRLAERWRESADDAGIEPSRELKEFVRASRQLSDTKQKDSIERMRRIKQQARTARLFRILSLAVSGVTVIALVALVFAGWQWWNAKKTAKEAERLRVEAVVKKDEVEKLNKTLLATNAELSRKDKIIETSSAVGQAYALINAGKLDEAEKLFLELLKNYQEKSEHGAVARMYTNLGDISFKQGRYEHGNGAIGRYDEAVKIYQKDEQSLNHLGQIFIKKGDLYFEWGKSREEKGDTKDARVKYNNSFGFYQKAINTFSRTNNSVGIREAKHGFDEAKKRYDAVKVKLDAQAVLKQNTSAP
jgi:tetratricopeptide (TPR) repeat protein